MTIGNTDDGSRKHPLVDSPSLNHTNVSENSDNNTHDTIDDNDDGAPGKKRIKVENINTSSKSQKHSILKNLTEDVIEKLTTLHNQEYHEFFSGIPSHTKLRDSSISVVGDSIRQKQLLKVKRESSDWEAYDDFVGTVWTAQEKEQFFTFLGRYGIKQVELIQQKIETKSILEIQNYYDLLSENLQYHKFKRSTFHKLAKYEEVPQALEIKDKFLLSLEEELAIHLKSKESQRRKNSQRSSLKRDLKNSIVERYGPENDGLIDFEKLLKFLVSFRAHILPGVSNPHECQVIPESKSIKTVFWSDIYDYTTKLIKDIIHDILTSILWNKSVSQKLETSTIVDISTGDFLKVDIEPVDIYQAFHSLKLKRTPFFTRYFATISDRLNFEILDDEEPLNPNTETYDYLNRPIRKFISSLDFDGYHKVDENLLFKKEFSIDPNDLNPSINPLNKTGDVMDENDSVFIVDENGETANDDILLDNLKIWLLLSLETAKVDETDQLERDQWKDEFLKELGLEQQCQDDTNREVELSNIKHKMKKSNKESTPQDKTYLEEEDDESVLSDYYDDVFLEETLVHTEANNRGAEDEDNEVQQNSVGANLKDPNEDELTLKKVNEIYEITPDMELLFRYNFS